MFGRYERGLRQPRHATLERIFNALEATAEERVAIRAWLAGGVV